MQIILLDKVVNLGNPAKSSRSRGRLCPQLPDPVLAAHAAPRRLQPSSKPRAELKGCRRQAGCSPGRRREAGRQHRQADAKVRCGRSPVWLVTNHDIAEELNKLGYKVASRRSACPTAPSHRGETPSAWPCTPTWWWKSVCLRRNRLIAAHQTSPQSRLRAVLLLPDALFLHCGTSTPCPQPAHRVVR